MTTTPKGRPPEPAIGASSPNSLVKDLGAAGPLAVLSALLPALGGFALLASLTVVGPWLREHGLLGVTLYASAFAVASGLALLPTYAQAVLGGWAFGFAVGTPAAIAGFAGGAMIAFVLAGRVAGADVERTLAGRPQWQAVRDELIGGGFWKTLGLVTLIRLPFNSPFALTNLALSAARTPIVPYAIGTILGMAPRTALAVWLAASISGELTSDTVRDSKPGWFLPVAIGLFVVAAIVITKLANRAIRRVASGRSPADA